MDETTLHGELMTLLRQLPGMTDQVFSGEVPQRLPQDANGNVKPYIVVFSGVAGDLPLERDLSTAVDTSTLRWRPQINAVGANADQALAVAVYIRKALTNTRLGNHWLKPDPDAFEVTRPIPDQQVSPVRFYLPLNFVVITN